MRLLLIFFLFLTTSMYAQIEVNEQQQQAYADVFSLRFEDAEKKLCELDKNPKHKAVNYHIRDCIDFLKVFIGEKTEDYKQGLSKRKERINFWEDLPDNSPYKNYFIGDSYLRWSLILIKFKEEFQSVLEFRKAYFNLKENHEYFPNFSPSNADFGVTKILLGSIPKKYQWITNLMNMKGSVYEGSKDIEKAFQEVFRADNQTYLKTPILFMQVFVQLNINLQNHEKTLQLLDKYVDKKQLEAQPLFVFLYANILQKLHRSNEALQVLSAYQPKSNAYPFYFLNYMKGLSLLHQLDVQCEDEFDTYIQHFEGENYIKSAYQKKAWYHLINGDTVSYQKWMQKIKTGPKAFIGADKQALKEAESGEIPNVNLLKSRLLFDGGFYKASLNILNHDYQDTGNISQKVEYHYRLGRNYHLLGNDVLAIQQYDFTYKYGKNLRSYFAANALLMKGEILIKQQKYKKAIKTFEKCLELSNFEYEWSIHRKCKLELERIREL